jgi:hypothetical protein
MCNGDVRHILEIVAILSGAAIFYQETRDHRSQIDSGSFILKMFTTPLGWGLSVSLFWIVAVPAYIYIRRSRGGSSPVLDLPGLPGWRGRVIAKTLLFLSFDFFLIYKQ